MAMGSFLGPGKTRRLQQSLVGAAREISGRCAAGGSKRNRFRSRREISYSRKYALCALFSRAHLSISVLSSDVPRRGIYRPAQSLLFLRVEGRRRQAESHACQRAVTAVAGNNEADDRRRPRGCVGHDRVLPAAADVAQTTERYGEGGLDGFGESAVVTMISRSSSESARRRISVRFAGSRVGKRSAHSSSTSAPPRKRSS